MMMDFAGRLKRLRIEKGYSQATLAKKISDAGQKPGEASIAKYENGRIYPNLQTAACMADCFGVSIDYLACGEKAAVVSVDGLTDERAYPCAAPTEQRPPGQPQKHPDAGTAGTGV